MSRRLLFVILIAALLLRLAYALAQDPLRPYENTGGDTRWYLANAYALVTDAPSQTVINGIPTEISSLEQPPVFFILTGLPQVWFDPAGATTAIRVLQVLMSTATCFFLYRMGRLLVGVAVGAQRAAPLQSSPSQTGKIAGLIAAAALAFSPAFFMEAADIKTETIFIFFVAAGMWLYLEAIAREERHTTLLILAGIIFGLATLTRAVFLLFPLALVVPIW